MTGKEKTLNRRDLVLFSVSAILLLDTLAAGAVTGPSVVFWWVFLGLVFFIPFGLMNAELGCTFPEQGGIYAWVRDAYGERWSARVTWSYWINIAVWLPAIYILFAGMFSQLFSLSLSLTAQIAIGIGLCWLTVAVNVMALEVGKWVPNLGAFIKMVAFSVIIIGGLSLGFSAGSANAFTLESVLPSFGDSFVYLPALIYGMLGFELVSASSEEMQDPARDVPYGIFVSGAIILTGYTLATVAILIALPADDIDLVEGLMDALFVLLGDSSFGRGFAVVLGVGVLYTFFSNGVTWALGGNRAMAEAAQAGEMPALLGRESARGTPLGAALALGVACTAVLLVYGYLAGSNEDLFWALFAFSAVLFIFPYAVLCPAFLTLRAKYPEVLRPFRVPGGNGIVRFLANWCMGVLVVTLVLFCWTPDGGIQWPVVIGSAVLFLLGEVVIRLNERRVGAAAPQATRSPGAR
ncbi:MAG: APC family permease [Pseudomonadota bacterium]